MDAFQKAKNLHHNGWCVVLEINLISPTHKVLKGAEIKDIIADTGTDEETAIKLIEICNNDTELWGLFNGGAGQ